MKLFKEIIKDPRIQEIIRFGLVGGLATILQIVIYYLLSRYLSHNVSLIISYATSLIVNFILTVYFTFQVKATAKKGIGFIISHAINFTLQFIFLNIFVYIGIDKQLAIIPVLAICIPINFLLVRYAIKKL
jgi:putative flippase GtrA